MVFESYMMPPKFAEKQDKIFATMPYHSIALSLEQYECQCLSAHSLYILFICSTIYTRNVHSGIHRSQPLGSCE